MVHLFILCLQIRFNLAVMTFVIFCSNKHTYLLLIRDLACKDPAREVDIGLVQIVIHDPDALDLATLPKLELLNGLVQPLPQRILVLSPSPAQPLLELVHAGRGQEAHARLQVRVAVDLAHALHLDVEDADAAGLLHGLDGGHGRAVVVAGELRRLDEAVLRLERQKVLLCHKVVFLAIALARAGRARRVRDRERKGRGVVFEEPVEECGLARAGRAGEDDGLGREGFLGGLF
jgi:hypothetical protein